MSARVVVKLLRLAAPSSKANEHERVIAALEVARLYEDGVFEIQARKEIPIAKREGRSLGWMKSFAARNATCATCGRSIYRGDDVWTRITRFIPEYTHRDCE